ncbi:hypothetical protein [Actinoplanes rectilineatus]|uniref:hypothetical protein n=1 Tax=Actinoplanes rectilineatus TaxID=113571 RepID=UPI0006975AA0|nr:hypothetical protein [Actinoplanes rectilineatus]
MITTIAAGLLLSALASPDSVCGVGDDRLREMSGLVTIADGYVTVNDSTTKNKRRDIFFLDADCAVERTVAYPSKPVDTEDLAVAPDGTLWVADIGDNDAARATVGLWRLAPGAEEPELFAMRYPDGAHDAETLVLNGDGTPIIVTKDKAGARVYTVDGALADGRLRAAGELSIPVTTTSNPRGADGRLVLTGGTNSPDGAKVAIRTYADAFEYPVANGDVLAALTTGTPQVTALPDEPQGESIAYSRDGTYLLTVSEWSDDNEDPEILRYASKLAPTPAAGSSLPVGSSLPAVPIAGGVIVLGLLGGWLLWRRFR